jgi:calpain-15
MEDYHDLWVSRKWKRAGELCPNFKLFGKDISPNDIMQGGVGDCYFLASVASFAERPNRVRAIFHNKVANSAGCYLIKLYVNGVPSGIMVDDLFLTDGLKMQFANCKNEKLWVPLLEKAWAKLLGSYTRIDGAYIESEVLHTFTGSPSKNMLHDEFIKDQTKKRLHWEMLKSAD